MLTQLMLPIKPLALLIACWPSQHEVFWVSLHQPLWSPDSQLLITLPHTLGNVVSGQILRWGSTEDKCTTLARFAIPFDHPGAAIATKWNNGYGRGHGDLKRQIPSQKTWLVVNWLLRGSPLHPLPLLLTGDICGEGQLACLSSAASWVSPEVCPRAFCKSTVSEWSLWTG